MAAILSMRHACEGLRHHVIVWLLACAAQVGSQSHSMDAGDLAWSPNGSSVAVQDSVLTYKVFIIRPDGQNLDCFRCATGCFCLLRPLSVMVHGTRLAGAIYVLQQASWCCVRLATYSIVK